MPLFDEIINRFEEFDSFFVLLDSSDYPTGNESLCGDGSKDVTSFTPSYSATRRLIADSPFGTSGIEIPHERPVCEATNSDERHQVE